MFWLPFGFIVERQLFLLRFYLWMRVMYICIYLYTSLSYRLEVDVFRFVYLDLIQHKKHMCLNMNIQIIYIEHLKISDWETTYHFYIFL